MPNRMQIDMISKANSSSNIQMNFRIKERNLSTFDFEIFIIVKSNVWCSNTGKAMNVI